VTVNVITPTPGKFRCPHCGTEDPPYDFVVAGGGNLSMAVKYVTVVCKGKYRPVFDNPDKTDVDCRSILSVGVLSIEIPRGLI
jgi:hypothetical protein